jgi:branched-chain amino acid transport system permease protein
VLVESLRAAFGGNSQRVPLPSWGQGATKLGFLIYPTYRLELIAIIATLLLGLYLVLYRTAMGLVVRAGIENPGMVGILGINVRRAFLVVFAIGVAAVGLAGMLYAPVVAVTPDMGANFMAQSFVVIVLGGLGSFPGAVVGGLMAGEIISLTSAFNASYSEVMLYALMALLLVLRPQGLFGSEGRV